MEIIYLDNNATTRPTEAVRDVVAAVISNSWGNPSGAHEMAKEAHRVVEEARRQVARALGADPRELVFTSGGTESNATAIEAALAAQPTRRHVVTSEVEHPSILSACAWLEQRGIEVTYLPVDSHGMLSLDDLEHSIRPDTALVSLMWADNESGVLFPIEAAAQLCRQMGVLFHTDAVQAFGKVPVNVKSAVPDFMSLSSHKIRGIKGTGALYVRRYLRFQSLIRGGHQESGRRAGTENVPGIAAFGTAVADMHAPDGRLRDQLEQGLLETLGARLIGEASPRLPNTSNICFSGIPAKDLLKELNKRGICASSGSACATGSPKPSHVLKAMGLSNEDAMSCVRFSLGAKQKPEEISRALTIVRESVSAIRGCQSLAADWTAR